MAEEKMEKCEVVPKVSAAEATEAQPKEVDIYRDTPLRYRIFIKVQVAF